MEEMLNQLIRASGIPPAMLGWMGAAAVLALWNHWRGK